MFQANLDDKLVQNRTSPGPSAENNVGLLKWKGVVLDSENEEKTNSTNIMAGIEVSPRFYVHSSGGDTV